MPKKPNAFYYYMIDFKEQQKKKGVLYRNLAEVAEAAGPGWKNMSPQLRKTYEERAKDGKEKYKSPAMKFTSWGEPLSELLQRQKEEAEQEEREHKDIKSIVMCKGFEDSILKEAFFAIDVNYYCKTNTKYVVCELGMVRFSLENGILDEYNTFINPGGIPIGYTSDAKIACAELGIQLPDLDSKPTDYNMLLANIHEYLSMESEATASNKVVLPPMFTLPSRVKAVQNFIYQLCDLSGEADENFRIYKIDTLFYNLSKELGVKPGDGFPKHSLAYEALKKDLFKDYLKVACAYHDNVNKSSVCALGRAKRWVYSILDHCCGLKGITLVPGKHLPDKMDLDKIMYIQEQQKIAKEKEREASVAAIPRAPSVQESVKTATNPWETSSDVDSCSSRSMSNILIPVRRLRPPTLTADLPQLASLGRGVPTRSVSPVAGPSASNIVGGVGPPSLTEEEFPALGFNGRGNKTAK